LESSDLRKQDLEARFQEYRLTAREREREVAHLWLSEKGALHISGELGISEGTVRNIVKNIYTKLRVNERKQFVKKLAD
jgi:DNA-binding CsgD family transcriptional regulator